MFDLLFRNPFRRWFVILLVLVNLLGSVYGYYWYSGQLAVTPVKLWLFTFDSPFSTTLFALALIGLLFGKEYKLLQLIAYTGVIKFGIWAAVIILHFWWIGGAPTVVVSLLLLFSLGHGPGRLDFYPPFICAGRLCFSAGPLAGRWRLSGLCCGHLSLPVCSPPVPCGRFHSGAAVSSSAPLRMGLQSQPDEIYFPQPQVNKPLCPRLPARRRVPLRKEPSRDSKERGGHKKHLRNAYSQRCSIRVLGLSYFSFTP